MGVLLCVKRSFKVYIMFLCGLLSMIGIIASPICVKATGVDSRNLVVVLDPGHGGEEDGANYYGIQEKDINLRLAKLLQEELQQYQGVFVALTRDTDEEVALWERANRASSVGADILLSMHFNASVSHKSNGASVYLSTGEYYKEQLMQLGDCLLGEFEAIGLNNAGMFARVTQMNGRRADGSFDDYYGVLRHAYNLGIPAMIVEHCYMDSEADKEFFFTEEGLKKLAIADAQAIAAHYGLCKPGGEVPIAKHATVFGATTKAVERNYYIAPQVESLVLKQYDGKTPGIATYEVTVKDEIGISTIYLVYKNVSDGTSFTVYLNLEESLTTGTYEVTTYFPSNLAKGMYHLSYIGAYNEVGFDAGYNCYNGSMVGYGKCDWLNTFVYSGEADLEVKEIAFRSPIQTKHIMKSVLSRIQGERRLKLQSVLLK